MTILPQRGVRSKATLLELRVLILLLALLCLPLCTTSSPLYATYNPLLLETAVYFRYLLATLRPLIDREH